MLFDSHVHFGQFKNRYYSPPQVLRTLECVGIKRFAYSSTSAVVTDDPAFMFEERLMMQELSCCRAEPILWVTHSMLKKSRDLSLYMDGSAFGFSKCKPIRGLKIHGGSECWAPNGKMLQQVFAIAREQNITVKIHTGEHGRCYAEMYKRICLKFPDVCVVLAHGRPLYQTIDMLHSCENVYVDTAFMPHEDLKVLLMQGFANRILFGTDTPIPGNFLKSSLTRHLRKRVNSSKKIADKDWTKISWQNALRVWCKIDECDIM